MPRDRLRSSRKVSSIVASGTPRTPNSRRLRRRSRDKPRSYKGEVVSVLASQRLCAECDASQAMGNQRTDVAVIAAVRRGDD